MLSEINRGGQTTAHRLRMFRQVLKIVLFLSILTALIAFITKIYLESSHSFFAIYYYIKAQISSILGIKEMTIEPSFWSKFSHHHFASSREVYLSVNRVIKETYPHIDMLLHKSISHLSYSFKLFSFSFLSFMSYFLIKGALSKKSKHLSGKRISNYLYITLRLKISRKCSDIKIGNLPFVKGTETMHTLVTGGTGSGKTNCLHHILRGIRKSRRKAIIVDTTGAFVEKYYRPEKDIILNPFDSRSADWHPWCECRNAFDYQDLAESMIPTSYQDNENYWRGAARSLLSSVLQKLSINQEVSEVVQWLLFEPLHKLSEFVEGTKAASHIDVNSEKTASSIRSVTSSFIECLEYLKDTSNPFSIREWISQKNNDSWLFLSCQPSERAAISPLLSTWISIAVKSVMNLSTAKGRQIWFILDELPTLNKIHRLETLVTEGRKYGACAVLALQNPSQLDAIYGRDGLATISGNCATKIIFAEYDAITAEKIAKIFGHKKIKECNEGISYGANDIRDGVTLSNQKIREYVVSPDDIQSLEPNYAYIKLPGNLPITKLKLKVAK